MKKINRILKNDDFAFIIRNGKKIHSKIVSIHFLTKKEKNFRVGISVSKKVSNKAVVRNKIKRRLTAILDKNNDVLKKWDVVIIAKVDIVSWNFTEISENLQSLLIKLK